jgi:hypothetical protein
MKCEAVRTCRIDCACFTGSGSSAEPRQRVIAKTEG